MKKEIQKFLKFLYLASSEESFYFDENINFNLFYNISVKNRVSNILFYGIQNNKSENFVIDDKLKSKMQLDCLNFGIKSVKQGQVFSQIVELFKKENIDLIAFKGIELQNLFIKPEMRVMGDIDFIVSSKDYIKAKNLLINVLNFDAITETHDELCLINQEKIAVELHQHLATELSNNQKYFDLEYKKNLIEKNNYFTFNNKFHFVYMMDHIYKHFVDGGLGLKYILDFALYIKKYPNILQDSLPDLKKLKLYNLTIAFLQICEQYLGIDISAYGSIFEKNISDKSIETLIINILKYGEYGTIESRVRAKDAQGTFLKRVIKRIFPPFYREERKNLFFEILIYPIRMFRWFFYFLRNTGYIKNVLKSKQNITDEEKQRLINMYNELK